MAVKNNNKQGKTLDVSALESWLWEAACVIRGPVDAPKLKDYILPLIFLESDGTLRRFDLVTANPMWNQKFPASMYENDTYGRFARGVPPSSSADWGWIQHMDASLNDGGKWD